MQSTPDRQNKDVYVRRQEQLTLELRQAGFDALALNPSPSLTYLTGMHFHLMERPVVAVFVPDQPVHLILPKLELPKSVGLPFPIQVFTYEEDPTGWQRVFNRAFSEWDLNSKRIGIEPGRMRMLEYGYLQVAAPQASFENANAVLEALRICKTAEEIEAMRQAVQLAQNALHAALAEFRVGMTERQLANQLTIQLLQAGSDPQFPFAPIVASGENSANPHAKPTDRPIQRGDLLVIDWGASVRDYVSDITRTFAVGHLDKDFQTIGTVVYQANAVAREIARPGIPAQEIDRAARRVIEHAGFGAFFTHRTGHGLGMEGHEAPYIREGNTQIMRRGMTFTIEPGIYLPGRGGVRIEDDMLITENGGESLTNLPREIQVIS